MTLGNGKDGQQIAGLLVRQRDCREDKRDAVEIGDGDICVGDRYRRPVFREIVRKVVRIEALESLGSRSITGVLLFTASTWTSAVAVLLLMVPSLTTISMVRVTFEGSTLCCCI